MSELSNVQIPNASSNNVSTEENSVDFSTSKSWKELGSLGEMKFHISKNGNPCFILIGEGFLNLSASLLKDYGAELLALDSNNESKEVIFRKVFEICISENLSFAKYSDGTSYCLHRQGLGKGEAFSFATLMKEKGV